ncbi:hypothetical protein NL676_026639 [Syzygium grande]|nr:hypothetical protein NL676_026639 [Syzygium grande]
MGRTNWKHALTGRDETLRVGEEKDPSLGFIGPLNLDLTLPLGAAPLLLFNDDFAFDVGCPCDNPPMIISPHSKHGHCLPPLKPTAGSCLASSGSVHNISIRAPK